MHDPYVIQQLKNWFIIDCILFKGDSKNKIVNESDFKQYLSFKYSFLTNLNEFYQHLNLDFKRNAKCSNKKILLQEASNDLKHASGIASHILTKKHIRNEMSNIVVKRIKMSKDKDPNRIADIVTENKMIYFSLDNQCIGIPLLENNIQMIPDTDFKSQILFESYKLHRDVLIRFAHQIETK